MAFDQTKYISDFQKEHYDTVIVRVPKGVKPEWQAFAKSRGLTMVELVKRSVEDYMQKN